jgi:putative ABC transport system permease protein
MIHYRVAGHLRAGLDNVRKSKFRSFWTMLGIIIGVTSVITIIAIGEGIKQQIGGQIHSYGANLITVRTSQLTAGSGSNNIDSITGLGINGTLNQNDVNTVSHVDGISSYAPLTLVSGSVYGDYGAYNDGFIIGTTQDLPSLLNQSLSYGGFLNNSDTGNDVAVVGEHAADAMFNEDVPLGKSFTFRGHTFIVKGIFNQFTTSPFSQQADFNDAIFIPNDVAESLSNNTAPTYEILARASNTAQTKLAAENVKAALTTAHGGQGGFSVLSGNQDISNSNSILNLLTELIAGVAAISLLVAGIGIMNVMLVSVSERVREIGIRKAVGATNRQILVQFMVEASLLSLMGGIIGVILSIVIDVFIRLATNLTPTITWQIVVLATGVSLLEGIIFGTVPAIKAARKDPIEALRAE